MDVFGSKRKVHASNVVMCVSHIGDDNSQTGRPPEERDRFWEIEVVKNRDGGNFSYKAKQEVSTGRVYEIDLKGKPKQSPHTPISEDSDIDKDIENWESGAK